MESLSLSISLCIDSMALFCAWMAAFHCSAAAGSLGEPGVGKCSSDLSWDVLDFLSLLAESDSGCDGISSLVITFGADLASLACCFCFCSRATSPSDWPRLGITARTIATRNAVLYLRMLCFPDLIR